MAENTGSPGVGLEAAFALDGPDANRELYAAWAPTYESEFVVEHGYIYHQQVAAVFRAGFTHSGLPVLDVGCGTGIVGAELRRLGCTVIDGIDISPEMLAKARSKIHEGDGDSDGNGNGNGDSVYRNLIEADLTGRVQLGDDSYAGIVSVGAFTHGHLGPESLLELLRVARLGAHCAIGINAAHFEEFGFGGWLDQRLADGAISSLRYVLRLIYDGADTDNPDNVSRIAVFSVGPQDGPARD